MFSTSLQQHPDIIATGSQVLREPIDDVEAWSIPVQYRGIVCNQYLGKKEKNYLTE